MESIPSNGVDSQVVTIIGLKILSRVGLGAKMNFTFFSTNQEFVSFELIKVKSHTASKSKLEGLFLVSIESLILIDDQSELHNFFGLQFVFHERPVGNSTIRGNREEVQSLGIQVTIPSDFPNWVCVLVGSDGGGIDGLVVTLDSEIEYHNCTIVKTYSQEGWVVWMEVYAHYTRVSLELVLWMLGVFESVTADETCCLFQEIVRTVTYAEQILVSRVPDHGCHMFLLRFWSGESPKWQN